MISFNSDQCNFTSAFYFIVCSVDRACYPEDLGIVQSTESISTSGNASKGEDMNACLEEVNKDSKMWQRGSVVAMDWLRIIINLENLTRVLLQRSVFSLSPLRIGKHSSLLILLL